MRELGDKGQHGSSWFSKNQNSVPQMKTERPSLEGNKLVIVYRIEKLFVFIYGGAGVEVRGKFVGVGSSLPQEIKFWSLDLAVSAFTYLAISPVGTEKSRDYLICVQSPRLKSSCLILFQL